MDLTEREFSALRRGDPEAFETMYRRYEKIVYNYLLLKTRGDAVAAGDVFSETFVSAHASVGALKTAAHIQGWLLRIASRRLADYLRRLYQEKKKRSRLNDGLSRGGDALDDYLRREKKLTIELALDRIKPEYAAVLKMKYCEEVSQADIAGRLGVKVSTVEGMLYRAREALKKELGRMKYL
jgi:RNA polymerase sigma factor (sigma-70 family)